jgi:drug/metabolite transporter (DMT)-like permease
MSTLQLFGIAVAIWGTTWIAIKVQIAGAAPEVGVALRFSVAALLLFAWCRWRGVRLRFDRRTHALFVLLGGCGFCLGYILIYHAERYIVSGLVAIGYSTMPLVNMLLARALFGTPMSGRVALGGVLGIAGIVLLFLPEVRAPTSGSPVATGATLTAIAVLMSSVANMVVAHQQREGVSGWAPMAWSMGYGALLAWIAALLLGVPLRIVLSPAFVPALLYLAVFGSVLAFAAYYALLARIGPSRAAYVGVSSTVVALLVSTLFEGYAWHVEAAFGLALAIAGNVLALQPARPRSVESSA